MAGTLTFPLFSSPCSRIDRFQSRADFLRITWHRASQSPTAGVHYTSGLPLTSYSYPFNSALPHATFPPPTCVFSLDFPTLPTHTPTPP